MSHEKGAYLGGIRDLQGLMERCFVDQDTGCWVWRGGMSHGFPCVSLRLEGDKRSTSMRGQRAAQLLAGKAMTSDDVAHSYRCKNDLCVNPGHGGVKGRAQHWQWMVSNGLIEPSLKHIAATVKRNKERTLVTEDMVRLMLSSDASCAEMGRQLGISASSVSNYRRGVNGRGRAFHSASVFSWRPAA